LVKTRKERDFTEQNRLDLAEPELAQNRNRKFLPAQLSEAEISCNSKKSLLRLERQVLHQWVK
jgi:uncharacterized protein YqeY